MDHLEFHINFMFTDSARGDQGCPALRGPRAGADRVAAGRRACAGGGGAQVQARGEEQARDQR